MENVVKRLKKMLDEDAGVAYADSDDLLTKNNMRVFVRLTRTTDHGRLVQLTVIPKYSVPGTVNVYMKTKRYRLAVMVKFVPTISYRRVVKSTLATHIINRYWNQHSHDDEDSDDDSWTLGDYTAYDFITSTHFVPVEFEGLPDTKIMRDTLETFRRVYKCGCGTVSTNGLDVCDACIATGARYDDCMICMKPVFVAKRANLTCCKATFHTACLDKWKARNNKRQKCPQCRAVL